MTDRPRRALARLAAPFEGPQTLGQGPLFWAGFLLVLALAAAYPLVSDGYTVGNVAYFFTWCFMALGLCLVWGYGGALSFGQTAFFGLAGYAYGVITINFGADTTGGHHYISADTAGGHHHIRWFLSLVPGKATSTSCRRQRPIGLHRADGGLRTHPNRYAF